MGDEEDEPRISSINIAYNKNSEYTCVKTKNMLRQKQMKGALYLQYFIVIVLMIATIIALFFTTASFQKTLATPQNAKADAPITDQQNFQTADFAAKNATCTANRILRNGICVCPNGTSDYFLKRMPQIGIGNSVRPQQAANDYCYGICPSGAVSPDCLTCPVGMHFSTWVNPSYTFRTQTISVDQRICVPNMTYVGTSTTTCAGNKIRNGLGNCVCPVNSGDTDGDEICIGACPQGVVIPTVLETLQQSQFPASDDSLAAVCSNMVIYVDGSGVTQTVDTKNACPRGMAMVGGATGAGINTIYCVGTQTYLCDGGQLAVSKTATGYACGIDGIAPGGYTPPASINEGLQSDDGYVEIVDPNKAAHASEWVTVVPVSPKVGDERDSYSNVCNFPNVMDAQHPYRIVSADSDFRMVQYFKNTSDRETIATLNVSSYYQDSYTYEVSYALNPSVKILGVNLDTTKKQSGIQNEHRYTIAIPPHTTLKMKATYPNYGNEQSPFHNVSKFLSDAKGYQIYITDNVPGHTYKAYGGGTDARVLVAESCTKPPCSYFVQNNAGQTVPGSTYNSTTGTCVCPGGSQETVFGCAVQVSSSSSLSNSSSTSVTTSSSSTSSPAPCPGNKVRTLTTGTLCVCPPNTQDLDGSNVCTAISTTSSSASSSSSTSSNTTTSSSLSTTSSSSTSSSTASLVSIPGALPASQVPNNGDGNGDGIPDSTQGGVATIPLSVSGVSVPATIVAGSGSGIGCNTLSSVQNISPTVSDKYRTPYQLISFSIPCPGTTTVTIYWYIPLSDTNQSFILRKYGSTVVGGTSNSWYSYPATITRDSVGGRPVVKATYTLTNNQLGDESGFDGVIVDPVAIAVDTNSNSSVAVVSSVQSTNGQGSASTGVSGNAVIVKTGGEQIGLIAFLAAILSGIALLIVGKRRLASQKVDGV